MGTSSTFLKKNIKENTEDTNLPLLSVIITIFSGTSHDNLFRDVPQFASGGRISIYTLELDYISSFLKEMNNAESSSNENIINLDKEMREVSHDAILFNFECCSGCRKSDGFQFPDKKATLKLIKERLDKGNMVMCSDFAVKDLINDWNENLGPNPFIKVGELSAGTTYVELFFEPKTLQECPSKQLQMVGQLCESGTTTIESMSHTIVIGINTKNIDNQIYKLSILTIVAQTDGYVIDPMSENTWTIGEKTGYIGHALLKYKSGGLLLVSSAHWIELSNLNVNIEKLEKVALINYGSDNDFYNEIEGIKQFSNEKQKEEKINMLAQKFIQQTAPCNYASKGAKI